MKYRRTYFLIVIYTFHLFQCEKVYESENSIRFLVGNLRINLKLIQKGNCQELITTCITALRIMNFKWDDFYTFNPFLHANLAFNLFFIGSWKLLTNIDLSALTSFVMLCKAILYFCNWFLL